MYPYGRRQWLAGIVGLLALPLLLGDAHAAPPGTAYDLRVNHLPPSSGGRVLLPPTTTLASGTPVFSWALRHPTRGARQAAFRLVLNQTSAGDGLAHFPRVVWDSGKVASPRSVAVPYGGATVLPADADFRWSVAWQDEASGAWSDFSPPAAFSTGLFAPANAGWAGTTWVGGLAADDERNQFRRLFALPAALAGKPLLRSRCYVAAPGTHETYLNGVLLQNADAEYLGPTMQFQRRLPYDAYDCRALLRSSENNVLATTLGRGWWALPDGNPQTAALGYSTLGARSLRVLVTAEFDDGTKWRLGDDGSSWKHSAGPVVYDSLFLGTVVDGRRETPGWTAPGFDDSAWDAASTVQAAAAATIPLTDAAPQLVVAEMPPMRRLSPRAPESVVATGPGRVLVDCGINMAGTIEIVFDDASAVSPGHTMALRRAEGVLSDGVSLDATWLLNGAVENCSYTFRADGEREVFQDRFAYFGFRYLELDGYPGGGVPSPDDITCYFVHTDLERSSSLSFVPPPTLSDGSSSVRSRAKLLNQVEELITRSALSNYASHPTDCPSREKRGWTGDGGHAAETLIMHFGMGAPYAKWLQDIADAAAQSGKGVVPDMSPFLFGNGQAGDSDPAWGTGFIDLLGWHHRYHGDETVLARHFAAAEAYLAYLGQYVTNATHGLLQTNYPGTRYGDWCAPSGKPTTPAGSRHTSNVISGYFWIRQLEVMAGAASVLGKTTAAAAYATQAGASRAAFGTLYFDAKRGVFRDPAWTVQQGVEMFQTEQALAITLALDLQDAYNDDSGGSMVNPVPVVPAADLARAAAALAADVANSTGAGSPHLNVGMVGIKYLFPALAATGHGDLALAALAAEDYPGFGYMVQNGEGTLWERWEGGPHTISGSRNHIMLGSPGQWMLQGLAGISLGEGAVAWDKVRIAPLPAAATAGSGLGGVDAIVGTPRGPVSVSWRAHPRGVDFCGAVHELDDHGAPLHVDCGAGGGQIAAVTFAAYGTPTGSCQDPSGLALDASCNAPDALPAARAACVGRASCTLYANNTQFGGVDPCSGIAKLLVVVAQCAGGSTVRFTLNASVPVGSTSRMVVPLPAGVAVADTVLTEGGATFFQNGRFVPGAVEGVASASATANGDSVEVVTGGGQYGVALWVADGVKKNYSAIN